MQQDTAPPKLKKSIGLVALTIYGVGNMLGAGIYGTVGKAAGIMGNALWMCFALSLVAAGLTGLCYASLGSRYPKAGGAAYISNRAFNFPMLAYVIGLAVVASGLTSMAGASRVFSSFALELFGLENKGFYVACAILGLIGGLTWINVRGLRESAWLNAVCTLIEASGLLFIIFIGMKYWGSVNYLDASTPTNPTGDLTMTLMFSGAVLTFYSFIGFEDLLNISEEVKEPRKTFPRALITALIITALIYTGVCISAISVLSVEEWSKDGASLRSVVAVAAPWFNLSVFSFIMLVAVVNTALLNFIMGSRMIYGMSKQGLLPKTLGRLHPKRHTPHVAIYTLTGIVLVLASLGDIGVLARATALLLLGAFAVVNISLFVLQHKKDEPKGGFEIPSFVPILGCVVCAVLIGSEILNAWDKHKTDAKAFHPLGIALAIVVGIAVMYLIIRPKAVVVDVDAIDVDDEANPSDSTDQNGPKN